MCLDTLTFTLAKNNLQIRVEDWPTGKEGSLDWLEARDSKYLAEVPLLVGQFVSSSIYRTH